MHNIKDVTTPFITFFILFRFTGMLPIVLGILLSILFFLQQTNCQAQGGFDMAPINRKPDSVLKSEPAFANYLKAVYKKKQDRVEAIYIWIAKSVSYDISNIEKYTFEENSAEVISRTFRTKRAICQGYSELFNDLCRRCGIESYIVHGFTKQTGKVKNTGHSWVVAILAGQWVGFDPTWGAGYLENEKFIRNFTFDYFMISPEELIATHMPFDPMWQCLPTPVSIKGFYRGEKEKPEEERIYHFADSIHEYVALTPIEQYKVTLRRMEQRGIYEGPLNEYAKYLNQFVVNEKIDQLNAYRQKVVETLNEASDHLNTAGALFNNFISYFNHQFTPVKPEAAIRHMIDTCETQLNLSRQLLRKVDPFNNSIKQSMNQLNSLIRQMQRDIVEQKAFVSLYIRTSKNNRGELFRK